MANIKSAKKRATQDEKRRISNLARKTAIKTAIKKVLIEVEQESGDVQKSRELLKDVAAKLARAKSKGLIHANTASRKLSRLAKRINKLEAAAAQK